MAVSLELGVTSIRCGQGGCHFHFLKDDMDNNPSPQIENGHTDIANEIMDALSKTRIPGEARQILDFIIRKTYGWHKKRDIISLTQFVLGTNLKKTTVCRGIKKLKDMNLIIDQKDNDLGVSYCFNKHYKSWKALPKKITLPKKIIGVTQKDNNRYPKRVPQNQVTKETTTKETNTVIRGGKINEPHVYTDDFLQFWEHYPRKINKSEAMVCWSSLNPDKELADKIILAVINQVNAGMFNLEKINYIPHPTTWLNNHRWENEIQINTPEKNALDEQLKNIRELDLGEEDGLDPNMEVGEG